MNQPAQKWSPATDSDRGTAILLATLPRGDAAELRLELAEFRGRKFISLRVWNKGSDGSWRPDGRKGCSIRMHEVGAALEALNKAAELAGGAA